MLKFLIDRTGYIKLLEDEDTPEAYSRIENLRELVNAAMDSRDRGETLDLFLDHAALIADADDYDQRAQITLMSLHAAKGLEFPLVFLSGLEEGLFPHSRTMLVPEEIEEERRLCYVGMTRAMDQLVLTRAVYRRRYGTDLPEASVPSRFLEEVPAALIEELGTTRARAGRAGGDGHSCPPQGGAPYADTTHYSYEDEDQSAVWNYRWGQPPPAVRRSAAPRLHADAARPLQLHREHRRVLRQPWQEIHRPENACRRAHRQARIPPRPEGPPSQIWRRHRLPARRRRRRSQDYGTISTLRLEEAGREVRSARTSLKH